MNPCHYCTSVRPPIFLLGSGRSGTTLVQRVLNTYPDITVWGEHKGFLKHIAEAYFQLTESPIMEETVFSVQQEGECATLAGIADLKRPERWQAWNNWFSRDDLKRVFRQHVEACFRPRAIGENEVWGFKEIRYGLDDRVIEFLGELFPDACFVFIVRNGLNTIESQLTTFHQGASRWPSAKRVLHLPLLVKRCLQWVRQNQEFLNAHRSGRLCSFWIQHEDLARDPNALLPLLKHLEKELAPEQRRVFDLDRGRGSSFPVGSDSDQRWRQMGYLALSVAETIVGRLNARLGYTAPGRVRWVAHLSRLAFRPDTKSRRSASLACPDLEQAKHS